MIRLIALSVLMLMSSLSYAAELPYKKFIASNAENIGKLSVGMTKAQVISLMGDHSSKVRDGKLNNPYRAESFQRDSSTYEVIYYLTRIHPPFTAILENQTTPVVLKDGVVTGGGRSAAV